MPTKLERQAEFMGLREQLIRTLKCKALFMPGDPAYARYQQKEEAIRQAIEEWKGSRDE